MPKSPPLTKKKLAWARNRNVNLRGTNLAHNAALEDKYARELQKLTRQMTNEVKKEITKLFKDESAKEFIKNQKKVAAVDANVGSQARILLNYLTDKFTKLFSSKAKTISEKMFEGIDKVSTSNLHSSLKQLSGGLSLKTSIVPKGFEDIASATIAENVSLIKFLT